MRTLLLILFVIAGCGGTPAKMMTPTGAADLANLSAPDDAALADPADLMSCALSTAITGHVVAPNGQDPAPHATVYIPNNALLPFPSTASCDLCNKVGDSLASTQTSVDGSFTLEGVPPDVDVQLVIQLGRFRRVMTVHVANCTVLNLPSDLGQKGIRLPGRKAQFSASDDAPRIAVASGDYDQIECVLKRMGIAQIDLYDDRGGNLIPPTVGTLQSLLSNFNKLMTYNMLVVNCTNNEFESLVADATIRANLTKYVGMGGRLYATDWAYDFIEQIPEFAPFMCFEPQNGAALMCQAAPQNPMSADTTNNYDNSALVLDADFAAWLKLFPKVIDNTKHVPVSFSFVVIDSVAKSMLYPTTTWVTGATNSGIKPMTVTFDYNSCGRVHYSTFNTEPNGIVPDNVRYPNCKPDFSPQERLLEYLVFEIANCAGVTHG